MRSILFLSVMNGYGWGGSEEQWYRLALHLARKKTRTTVVVFDWPEKKERLDKLQQAGCQVILLPRKQKGSVFYGLRVKSMLGKIPFQEFDHVFINQGGWEDVLHGPFKTLYKKLPSYTLCFHNHQEGSRLSHAKLSLFKNWVYGSVMNLSDAKKTFDVLEKDLSLQVPNKQVVYNPITFTPPESSTSPANNPDPVWVMLAALDVHRKVQDILIRVLSADKWRQRKWQLHLYGDGPDKAMLQQLIDSQEINDKILLKGHTNQIEEVLRNCDMLLQCTRIDAMPISVTEAMAMSRPCIVSTTGDMPLWVNKYNGYTCPKLSSEELDTTLEQAWQQREHWSQLGIHAFEKFQHMYPQPYEEKLATLIERATRNNLHNQ